MTKNIKYHSLKCFLESGKVFACGSNEDLETAEHQVLYTLFFCWYFEKNGELI